jgi:hypothetical protein
MTKTAVLKSVVATGVLFAGLGAGAVTALATEGSSARHFDGNRREHCQERPGVPMSGTLVGVEDDNFTIVVMIDEMIIEECLDGVDYEIGDTITFQFGEELKVITLDENGDPQESGDISDIEEGETVFVRAHKSDDGIVAFSISSHRPLHPPKVGENRGEHPRKGPVGEVMEIDTETNTVRLELRNGTVVELTYDDDVMFMTRDEESEGPVETDEYAVEVGDHLKIRGHYDFESEEGDIETFVILEPIDWDEVDAE